MRFSIERDAFLKPLRMVAGVVERKHTQLSPILLNVLIRVEKGRFSLSTTDQEMELVATGVLEDPEAVEGALTVPVRKLLDICKTLPEEKKLSLIEEGNRIILRAGRSRFSVSTLPAQDFPVLQEFKNSQEGVQFSIGKKILRELLGRTSFSMAEQDVRYYLNGMLLEVKNNFLYSVASDGHRLALAKVPLMYENTNPIRAIVPRKGILELQRLLDEGDAEIQLWIGKNHICAIAGEVQLSSKLLEGRFPEYENLMRIQGERFLVAERETLKESFQRAAALFSDKFKGVCLRLSKDCLNILALNPEQDEVEEEVELQYEGRALEIGFNIKYLIDFLTVLQSDQVKFTFSDSNGSARVEGFGSEAGIYVIMPMKI